MSNVIILGAGLAGLTAAMLLARDGHEVTVLEKDVQPPPSMPSAASAWSRPGVHQFRHIHLNLARWFQYAQAELPELPELLLEAGGLRINLLKANPALNQTEFTVQDARFETVTARRPVLEAVLAQLAADTPGVRIVRGERVTGFLRHAELPQVTGVRTGRREWPAELVVDATGRRSTVPLWLKDARLPEPVEQMANKSSVYYSRHFRSADGGIPEFKSGTLQPYDGLSIITLPADSGTWSVALVGREDDAELQAFRNPDTWLRTLAQYPAAAHWGKGEPLSDDVHMIAALHDRSRTLLVNGEAATSGLVLLGDAWACTDPSLGRGSSITFRHAMILRDTLRTRDPVLDGRDFTSAFEERTQNILGPIVQRSWWFIRNRLAEMAADATGEQVDLGRGWLETQATRELELHDSALARGFAGVAYLLQASSEAFANPAVLAERVDSRLSTDFNRYPLPGPTRQESLTGLGD